MTNIIPGLVSITFRQLSPQEVVNLIKKTSLKTIEWGGDVHVPHGKVKIAKEVKKMTEDAGLEIAAYGSYYRVGHSENEDLPFEKVLESAVALGVSCIRVWAGAKGSDEVDDSYRHWINEESLRIAEMAKKESIEIAYEFHRNSLTDTNESTLRLLKETDHSHIKTLWQPPHGEELSYCVQGLRAVLPKLSHVHAFHWWPDPSKRFPLADGKERWKKYFEVLKEQKRKYAVLLEFVQENKEENLIRDAKTLCDWIEEF